MSNETWPPADEAPKDGPRRVTVDGQTWECTLVHPSGRTTWRLDGGRPVVYLHADVGEMFRAWLASGRAFTMRQP